MSLIELANDNFERGRYERALAQYSKALEADQGSVYARIGRARALIRCGRIREAADALSNREDYSVLETIDSFWLAMGEISLSDKRSDDAAKCFRSALRVAPDSAQAIAGLAEALHQQAKDYESMQLIEESIARLPKSSDLYQARAVALAQQGKLRRALDACFAMLTSGYTPQRLGMTLRVFSAWLRPVGIAIVVVGGVAAVIPASPLTVAIGTFSCVFFSAFALLPWWLDGRRQLPIIGLICVLVFWYVAIWL